MIDDIPPTTAQIDYIRMLEQQKAVKAEHVSTSAEADAEIRRLKDLVPNPTTEVQEAKIAELELEYDLDIHVPPRSSKAWQIIDTFVNYVAPRGGGRW